MGAEVESKEREGESRYEASPAKKRGISKGHERGMVRVTIKRPG